MNMFETDESHLVTKYGIGRPPKPDNPHVDAVLAVERAAGRAALAGGNTSWLFDPALNEKMWERANEAIREMWRQHGDFMAGVWDSGVFLYYPGQSEFHAHGNDIERFAYLLGYANQNGCDIKLAPGGCGDSTVFLPLERGQFLVVFEICTACDEWARHTAETNFRVSVLEAQAKLPPGARIDPGSPVPPRP